MPLPGPGGFYISATSAHTVRVRQEECTRLDLHRKRTVSRRTPTGESYLAEIDHTVTVDLTPAPNRLVRWGEDSLTWRQRYTPAGFRWPPWRKEWMELRLKKLPDGSLEYYLKQEGPGHKVIGEIRCVLPPAEAPP